MKIDSLNSYISERISSKKPFVFYRLSGDTQLSLIENDEVIFLDNFPLAKEGFIFHPFSVAHHNIELLEGKATQVLLNEKNNDSLPLTTLINKEKPFISDFNLYQKQFASLQEDFAAKRMKKAILSRIKWIDRKEINLHQSFLQVLQNYPEAYAYLYYSPSAGVWMGASPEKFIHLNNKHLETTALAGTISEGEQFTNKEMEEQMVVTHFITQNLHHLKNLEADSPEAIRAGNLIHIRANIRGEIDNDSDITDIVNKLHPTPAVGGFPKEKALEKINLIEKHDREFYSGFAGTVGKQQANLFVNLRCAQFYKDGIALYVGGGITKLSIVEKEWQETEKKAQTIERIIK